MSKGTIKKVAGPLVIAEGMRDANMFDVVRVSSQRLIGEIIEMHGDQASVQVYEETSGLGPGEPVESTGAPLSVELGPGLIGSIFDGIQRPLEEIMKVSGNNLQRGVEIPALDHKKKWHFTPLKKAGDSVTGGDIIGTVQETPIVVHKILVPHGLMGTIRSIKEGDYNIDETVAVVDTPNGSSQDLTLLQRWPVRVGRPYKQKLSPDMPLVTGQRVIDTLFPIAKGGVAAVPGPFGSEGREGALSVIGAVSPPGGDISEPVSQATLRIVKVFWSLDSDLAYKRHFPAVNWLTSYSLYVDTMEKWFNEHVDAHWMDLRARLMRLLQEEAELNEIVQLVGMDALSAPDRLKLEASRSIREDFLHQDAFHEVDTYTPLQKQFTMMQLVLDYYDKAVEALDQGASIEDLVKLPVREQIGRFKYVQEKNIQAEYEAVLKALSKQIDELLQKEDF